ncbi:MAG: NAD(P)/FAD-dependent oxidoreductase [Bacteroidia bacterium]|nr:NAD(P)/FAD-dependent oxidoreductase [Bacteroidia bacterium]
MSTGNTYDVVIIGSGLGGLCSAVILSKEGLKVCVLEKNRQLGGSLQIFSRDKVIFDTGIHYIGGLDEGQNLNRYFKYLGLMDKLRLKKLDEDGFDKISFYNDEQIYSHAQGYDNFIRVLAEKFPGEEKNIKRYCEKILEICSFFPLYNLEDGQKDLFTANFLEMDTKAFLKTVTSNEKLQNVLAGSNPLYAGEADKTPLYVHALVVNTYIESSYRCIDGGAQIAKHLSDTIKKQGGEIYNYSEARHFHFSGDQIKAVQLSDGRLIEGKKFISNCDLAKTLDMIGPGHIRQAYRSRISNLENSISAFILYIVLKKGSVPYFNHNLYHYDTDDVWDTLNYTEQNWPRGFALFSQYSSRNPDNADSMIMMGYMNYKDLEQWSETVHIIPNMENFRGAGYEEFKERKAQQMFDALYKRMPELKGKVESYYTSTPLTYRDYIGSRDGTLYGIAKDYRDPLKTFISPKTKVPNLFLTGQNLNLHGVLGVTVSSVVTCSELLGQQYLIKKIKDNS